MNTVAWPATSLSGQLQLRDARVDGRVVLDRALDLEVGPPLAHGLGRLAHAVDVLALFPDSPGRVGEHRDPRLDRRSSRPSPPS